MKLYVVFLLALMLTAQAVDMVAINSFDGRDVLSGVFYANVLGVPVKFMPSQGGDPNIFSAKVGSGYDILLIQSSTDPVSGFVQSDLEAKNNTVELYSSDDGGATNLYLANLSGATSFIVVDSAYSDSAISVLPYARLTKSYVILADNGNAAQVAAIVAGKKVTIFGLVDKNVSDDLAADNPTYIGTGADKYEDNVIIANMTMTEFNISRLIIVDGTSLEDSMAAGDQPIVLSGPIVPQPTYDFIKESVREGRLQEVMLIGNDLVVPIYDMRQKMINEFAAEGLNKTFGIFVKFAQVVPSATNSVLNLDTFTLPAYIPALNVSEVDYNTQSGNVMVSLNNTGNGAAYFSLELRIKLNGQDYSSFPVTDPALINTGEQKGLEFPFNMSNITEGNITALVIVRYGASNSSLDQFISTEGPLASISYVDKSNVSVQAARYDSGSKTLLVTLQNTGGVNAYADSNVTLSIGGAPATISGSGTEELDPGALVVEEFPLTLSDADLAANSNVKVDLSYGARPGFLVNSGEFVVPMASEGSFPVMTAAIVLIILIVLAIAAYMIFGRKAEKPPAPAKSEPAQPKAAKKK